MKVRYHSASFPRIFRPECRLGWQEFDFDIYDLIKAAFTVGRANRWDIFAHGPYSYYEMIYRSAMIFANVAERNDGHLGKTPAYLALDPSEKSAVSYFLGLTMTKLMTDKLMDIPYLMHLERYSSQIENVYGPITYRNGKSRPDLIAISRDLNPHVFEAKGRSGNFSQDAFNKAKNQARMIINVGGVQPVINVGIEAYFTNQNKLEVRWQDPEPNEVKYRYDFLNIGQMVKDYYKPFTDLIGVNYYDSQQQVNNMYVINPPGFDLTIKIPRNIVEWCLFEQDVSHEKVKNIILELPELIKIKEENEESIVQTSDGLRFEFGDSWKKRFGKIED